MVLVRDDRLFAISFFQQGFITSIERSRTT
jgi:hypothetical protein